MSKRLRREIKSIHIFEGTDDSALLEACYILITARRARLAAKTETALAPAPRSQQDSPASAALITHIIVHPDGTLAYHWRVGS